jgi:hypothetical protein
MGGGDHLLHGVLCLVGFGFDSRGGTMIYIVIHPTADGGVLFSGAYSNLRAANECADEADFYQGLVFAVDMNEVRDTYEEDNR